MRLSAANVVYGNVSYAEKKRQKKVCSAGIVMRSHGCMLFWSDVFFLFFVCFLFLRNSLVILVGAELDGYFDI